MKISKLLSSSILYFFTLLLILFNHNQLLAEEEAIDIWNIKESEEIKEEEIKIDSENIEPEINMKIDFEKLENGNLEIVEGSNLDSNIILAGLYDPSDNGLSIDMWSQTDGQDIIRIFKRLNKLKLSQDANEILKIALLTNSYIPKINISEDEFINFKLDYLIRNNNLELIKSFIIKNQKVLNSSKLTKFYIESYLSNSDLQNACGIFKQISFIEDIYLTKFKIYCLINENKREEAQLQFDLIKENNFNDVFFEKKFNYLMGYSDELQNEISDKNILEFHLSHRTISDFKYKPNQNTPKIIWKYLSSANLFEKVDDIDLENQDEILLIEKAVHEKNYNEKDLLELYKRFKFNINQLINVQESYKLLSPSQGRALL